jgi:hypothetical protein
MKIIRNIMIAKLNQFIRQSENLQQEVIEMLHL